MTVLIILPQNVLWHYATLEHSQWVMLGTENWCFEAIMCFKDINIK